MSLDPLLCEKHSEVSHDARYKILQLGLRKYTSALRCPSAASVAIATKTKNLLFQCNVHGNQERSEYTNIHNFCFYDYPAHYPLKVYFWFRLL